MTGGGLRGPVPEASCFPFVPQTNGSLELQKLRPSTQTLIAGASRPAQRYPGRGVRRLQYEGRLLPEQPWSQPESRSLVEVFVQEQLEAEQLNPD
ncbi:hypothetical protein AMECASPLE_018040 [Ameca splendens]|uniref:Uncharacterized protein n=1 Tax=Ameca splendens TaxID=208324 RepID=A0ABV0XRM4_9TELE